MRAIVHHRYGSPDVLRCEDVEKPTPGDDEVLIKVHAASVNPADWHLMRGTPYIFRMMIGLRKPKDSRLGLDVAGQVEAVGRNVTGFKRGDEVFGACRGAFAEHVCTSATKLVAKPTDMTFEQAASVPVAALTALQGIRDNGGVQPGQKVLINGAAGGVGTFAVQIAKSFGAEVTGVCSTTNVALVRSIRADWVVDYTREDFTTSGQQYDLLLDCVANHSLSACRRALKPQGRYIMVSGSGGHCLGPLPRIVRMMASSRPGSKTFVMFVAKPKQEDLTTLRDLMQTGRVTPVIDRRYPLSEVAAAMRYLEEGHARGKVVIILD